jgi:hypothetical protein
MIRGGGLYAPSFFLCRPARPNDGALDTSVLSIYGFPTLQARAWLFFGEGVPRQAGRYEDKEPIVLRKMTFLAAILWLPILSTPAFAQDQPQPSLGDVARQARKEKANNTAKPKTVITDDTFPSSKAGSSALSAVDLTGSSSQSSSGSSGDPLAEAMAKFNEAEADFKQLDSLDQATLAKVALVDDCDVQFPSRSSWEVKLYAAKGAYVTHMRFLIGELKQLTTEAQGWKGPNGKLDPNDPRVQSLKRKVGSIMQDALQADATWEGVVAEGVALAKSAKR